MVDVVKEACDICFHDIPIASALKLEPQIPHGIFGADVWTVAIAGRQKVFLVNRPEDARDRTLQQFIFQCW